MMNQALKSKLLMCKFFKKGACTAGEACRHAHSRDEQQKARKEESQHTKAAHLEMKAQEQKQKLKKQIEHMASVVVHCIKEAPKEVEQAMVVSTAKPQKTNLTVGLCTCIEEINIQELVDRCARGEANLRMPSWADMTEYSDDEQLVVEPAASSWTGPTKWSSKLQKGRKLWADMDEDDDDDDSQ